MESDIDELRQQVRDARSDLSGRIDAIGVLADEGTLDRSASAVQVPALLPLLQELKGLREDMSQLRRRIALRAKAGGLDPESAEQIADAVAARFERPDA